MSDAHPGPAVPLSDPDRATTATSATTATDRATAAVAATPAGAPAGGIRLWGAPSSGSGVPDADGERTEYRAPTGRLVGAPWLLATLVFEPGRAREWEVEQHREHELLWCEGGALDVEAQGQHWLVPASLGLWLPAGTPHRVRANPDVTVRATYLDPDLVAPGWETIVGVPISALLRELLLHDRAAAMPDASRAHLQALAVEQMVPVTAASIDLRMPSAPGLRQVAEDLVASPGDDRTVDAWASSVGMSSRTFMRRVVEETGSSFAQWRILARMGAALVLLAAGEPVASVAREVGYSSTGTFATLFRRTIGMTPALYARTVAGNR